MDAIKIKRKITRDEPSEFMPNAHSDYAPLTRTGAIYSPADAMAEGLAKREPAHSSAQSERPIKRISQTASNLMRSGAC